jgi:predicted dehydrogenase
MTSPARVALIGCGLMMRHHVRSSLLKQQDTTHITALCEPSEANYALMAEVFTAAEVPVPPNQPDLARLLRDYPLDAVFIATPHADHHDQTRDCLEAGLDVLLEKPMVMNAAEAQSLIDIRDRTGRLLVVAFPGSLSPYLRTAVEMLRSGQLGRTLSISATIWQDWGAHTVGTWRQVPALSGGGFLFDTGAHMLNTVVDLAGEEFVEVAAWLDDCGRPVETMGVIIGRLASGALVTLHGCGEAIPSCASDIRLFSEHAILRTGMWGEFLELQRSGETALTPVAVPPVLGVWEQFLRVRRGELPNPCPPEVGLRMARLYDAIKLSAAQNGVPVKCGSPLVPA